MKQQPHYVVVNEDDLIVAIVVGDRLPKIRPLFRKAVAEFLEEPVDEVIIETFEDTPNYGYSATIRVGVNGNNPGSEQNFVLILTELYAK